MPIHAQSPNYICRNQLLVAVVGVAVLWSAISNVAFSAASRKDPPGDPNLIFQDNFNNQLGQGWFWIREHRDFWRVTSGGLEVRIEPGNMWGPQNNAKNVLVRSLNDLAHAEIEASVQVENNPTNQYEQVDLVWYYNDSNMVKIGEELVDGKLSVVMGREEHDKTRTIAIIPLSTTSLHLRLIRKDDQIRGQFRLPGANEWQNAGECSLPAPAGISPNLSLQFYQGARDVEHWARVTEFRLRKR